MAQIFSKLRLKNFSGYQDTGSLEFSNLNLFLGPNSAGKSSLLHTFPLLRQTFEDPNPENRLITDGTLVQLGSFSDLLFKHDLKLSLGIEMTLGRDAFIRLMPRQYPREYMPDSFSLEFAATQRVRRVYLKNFRYFTEGGRDFVSGSFSTLGDLKSWKLKDAAPERGMSLSFFHFLPQPSLGSRSPRRLPDATMQLFDSLWMLRQVFGNVFGSVIHLQPIRTPIKSDYRVTGESPTSVGATGENLLGVLYRDQRRAKGSRKNLLGSLNQWLDAKFNLVRDVQLEALTKSRTIFALTGRDSKTGADVNLASVGFGVSQVAPVIVQGFLSPPQSCLVIEQPEIHLHPGAQAELGDLFIEFSETGKQLFVETHSQYLLFRIQRRIAEGKFDASKLRVFFVSRTSSGSQIEPLHMDERGRISNWPEGFFEEGYQETAATAEALAR
ncbi:MAG: DUF3696 domain-containing protein [Acidobacteriaceae bacterium]